MISYMALCSFGYAAFWGSFVKKLNVAIREENSVHSRVIYTGVFLLTTDRHRFFIMPPCGVQLQTFIVPSVVVIRVNCRFVSLNDKRDDDYQVTIQPDDCQIGRNGGMVEKRKSGKGFHR